MSIGSRIKQRREELGLTQPELAKLVGISKGSIGNYESNVSSPNEKILFKLFEILKCDANFLRNEQVAGSSPVTSSNINHIATPFARNCERRLFSFFCCLLAMC